MSTPQPEHVKNLVVGCGLSGMVVAERIASQSGEPVLIIDKRAHIGGNIYDEKDPETGVTVHKYGPHVFHTNSKEVWDYLSHFTEWHPFMYRVKAVVDGTEVPVPFNLDSLHTLFPRTMATRIEEKLIASFGFNTDVPILKLRETKDEDLHLLADFIYEKVFAGYTMKQWGLTAEQMDASVSARVPVRVGRDDRYFRDTYQAIPAEGYTAMARRMLDHPLIELRLNTNWSDVKGKISYDRLFFTGPIDEFFDYEFGALPYRSLDLQFRNLPREFAQSGPQINFPCNYDFTRQVEYKYYLDEKTPHTTISREYPCAYSPGKNEPYYPIPSPENAALYERYAQLASSLPNTHFLGRLASYRYLNMDQTVGKALRIFGIWQAMEKT